MMKQIALLSPLLFILGCATTKTLPEKPILSTPDFSQATIIELVLFSSNPEVSDKEMIAKAHACDPIVSAMPGFIHRNFSKDEDGTWADIVYWTDMQSAQGAAENVMGDPSCMEFFALIDQSKMQMKHLQISSNAPK